MLERAKAEPAQQQVEQPPIVVVDPDPDDADDDIGHQDRGEPDDPQDGAARGLAGGLAGPPAPLGFNRRQRPLARIPRESVERSAAADGAAASSFDKLRMRLVLLGDATKSASSC